MAVNAGNDPEEALSGWPVDAVAVRERMYRAPTARERERWHALWLAQQGWSAARVAAALGRDPHTVGGWLAAFRRDGPAALAFAHTGGSPRPEPGAAGSAQGGGAAPTAGGGHRPGHLALEGGAVVRE